MKKLLYCTVLLFSIIYYANAQSVVVNSDGSHSIGVNHGSTTVVIHPDGTHSIGINHGTLIVAVNPDGTHSSGFNQTNEKKDISKDFSHSCSSTSEYFLYQDNHLFSEDSSTDKEELDKLKILMLNKILRLKEYRMLKNQCLEVNSDSNKANQIYDLYKRLVQEDISKVVFSDRKTEIINSNEN